MRVDTPTKWRRTIWTAATGGSTRPTNTNRRGNDGDAGQARICFCPPPPDPLRVGKPHLLICRLVDSSHRGWFKSGLSQHTWWLDTYPNRDHVLCQAEPNTNEWPMLRPEPRPIPRDLYPFQVDGVEIKLIWWYYLKCKICILPCCVI